MTSSQLTDIFQNIYHHQPTLLVRAPGRINLIGEHTDYNEGFVLPAAIDKAIYFAIAKRSDKRCCLYAIDLQDSEAFELDAIQKSDKGWANFLIGVTAEILKETDAIDSGFDVVFGGDVPLGAGLSSSAAVESGMGFALNTFDLGLTKMQLALIAQRAEHNFAGVNCGIMDMFASIHGRANAVIRLDCKDMSYHYFPFNLADYQLVLCNSGVKHSLANSAYNTRRQECEQGVTILSQFYANIKSLRDLSLLQVEAHRHDLPANVYLRCRYVTGENERMLAACQDLEQGDLLAFGQKMYATHNGLSKDYEVSCAELDFLVEQTKNEKYGVIGSRLMGGGFGGCTINLVKKDAVSSFIDNISQVYEAQFGRALSCYVVKITDGVSVM
jgi:galactokinase